MTSTQNNSQSYISCLLIHYFNIRNVNTDFSFIVNHYWLYVLQSITFISQLMHSIIQILEDKIYIV